MRSVADLLSHCTQTDVLGSASSSTPARLGYLRTRGGRDGADPIHFRMLYGRT